MTTTLPKEPPRLDDYEDGMWTPSVKFGGGGITFGTQAGIYVKDGPVAHFDPPIDLRIRIIRK